MEANDLDNLFTILTNTIQATRGKHKPHEDKKVLKALDEKIKKFIEDNQLSEFKVERLFSFLISTASAKCHEHEIFDRHLAGLFMYQMQCALVNVKLGKI